MWDLRNLVDISTSGNRTYFVDVFVLSIRIQISHLSFEFCKTLFGFVISIEKNDCLSLAIFKFHFRYRFQNRKLANLACLAIHMHIKLKLIKFQVVWYMSRGQPYMNRAVKIFFVKNAELVKSKEMARNIFLSY